MCNKGFDKSESILEIKWNNWKRMKNCENKERKRGFSKWNEIKEQR